MKKHYALRRGLGFVTMALRAVDGVTMALDSGRTFTLVGESGSGKSTTARMVLRLERPSSGTIRFHGRDVHALVGSDLGHYRASVQAVFQDPYSSLNPRMRAREIISEPLEIQGSLRGSEQLARINELFAEVGLNTSQLRDFPHEFSGGMRQRLALARALATSPSLIVLDEPVSALDVSIRAQIMNLLKDLQARHGIAYLLIAHNLATVRYLSDDVAAMYLGQLVEVGPAEGVFHSPRHPYTVALLSAAATNPSRRRIILEGEVPSPVKPPGGCRFHTRCWLYKQLGEPKRCRDEVPDMRAFDVRHSASCHFSEHIDWSTTRGVAQARSS